MVIHTPIIIDNRGDILVFESTESATRYIEPIDVENNEYVAFDSKGYLLQLYVVSGRVHIKAAESSFAHTEILREILSKFLASILARKKLSSYWIEKATLYELIQRAIEYKTE